jgi:serine/threonine protein kinase
MQEELPRGTAARDEPGSTVPVRESQGRDELIGRVLGSYRVVKLLGEGGMGAVYMGEHPAIGSKVAIKVLHPRYAADQRIVDRFFNEARAVNIIGHDNIVKILDFNVADGTRHYFVMDFLHGRTLQSVVQAGRPVPLRRIAPILLQCCRALQAAHDHGIIHRDFKPDNVFLVDQGDKTDFVKLVDFGIAKLNESSGGSHTQTGTVMGTPAYMSPEQAGGEPVIDARSDIYSLGITLFQMATGRLPFADAGPSFGKLLAAHLQQLPPTPRSINPEVPGELEEIILKTLEKDPAQRFQSMSELHDALARCMDALGVSTELPRIGEVDDVQRQGSAPAYRSGVVATPARGATVARTQRIEPSPRPGAGRRAAVVIGAGLGLALVVVATLLVWRLRQPEAVEAAPPSVPRTSESAASSPPGPSAPQLPSSPSQSPAPAPPGSASQRTKVVAAQAQGTKVAAGQAHETPAAVGSRQAHETRAAVGSIPPKTAVSFRCGGPQEICGPLRAALDEALAKAAFRGVRDPARADVQVEATVAGTQGRTSAQFGTTFAVRTYSIDLAGEATKTSEAVPMPQTATVSYDPSFGSDRVAEKSRVLAGEIVDSVQAFLSRQRP